jgi:hypothetical protein
MKGARGVLISLSTLRCPNCDHDIELVGQKNLTEEYGLGPNPVAHLRQQGVFPEPALSFGNRNMWLRADIVVFLEERSRERLEKLVEDFDRTLAALPEAERKTAVKLLADGHGKK